MKDPKAKVCSIAPLKSLRRYLLYSSRLDIWVPPPHHSLVDQEPVRESSMQRAETNLSLIANKTSRCAGTSNRSAKALKE